MALISMTGFGKGTAQSLVLQIEVELKSVNHRFLDISFKLPQLYSSFELELSRKIRERVQRGRLEIVVLRTDLRQQQPKVSFNKELFNEYLGIVREALSIAGVKSDEAIAHAALTILQRREVLEVPADQADLETEKALVHQALAAALADLIEMRSREGDALSRELQQQLESLERWTAEVSRHAALTPELFRERLAARIEKLNQHHALEPERLAQELAVVADRIDITEELARLQSHIEQFRTLSANGNGKKLEFLLQEMGREINTAGTKGQNAEIARCVIEAKAVIEKLREQVQNVE